MSTAGYLGRLRNPASGGFAGIGRSSLPLSKSTPAHDFSGHWAVTGIDSARWRQIDDLEIAAHLTLLSFSLHKLKSVDEWLWPQGDRRQLPRREPGLLRQMRRRSCWSRSRRKVDVLTPLIGLPQDAGDQQF
jgi:hypothetical protein